MNYTYHIYTPYWRRENFIPQMEMLSKFGIIWHPIFDDLEFHAFPDEWVWIQPLYCPMPEKGYPGFPGHYKANYFLEHEQIVPDHRYCELNDDDWYEPDFFEKIDKCYKPLVVCSMLRGQRQPLHGRQYGTSPLVACKENIRCGNISSEQLIVLGSMIGKARYGRSEFGDWDFIEQITRRSTPQFCPEAHVWFNYLEPGRWDK